MKKGITMFTQFSRLFSKNKPEQKRWQDDLPPLPTKVVVACEKPANFNDFFKEINNEYKQLR